MRSTEVSKKIIGERLGKDIYSDAGRLLLGKGVLLNDALIDKLANSEIYFVYIDDEFSEGIEIEGIVDDRVIINSINKVKNVLKNVMKKDSKSSSAMIPEKDMESVKNVMNSLIEALEESEGVLYTVVNLMGADMYTYSHSINVAILTTMTCKSLGYDYDLTKKIALGALLHDIGKAEIQDGLIQKSDELTDEEMEEVFTHAEKGYELIKDDITLSGYTKQVVRLHHEKRDGSGYPLKLKETEIPDFVRIVTICDMFDAMTTDRVYRQKMPIHKAIEILMVDSVFKLDSILLQMFIKNICVYPPGTGVVFSDERYGIVKKYNATNPTRPLVKMMYLDEHNEVVTEDVDLLKERTLFIDKTIDTEIIKEKFIDIKN